MAALDRLTHGAHFVEITGQNFRAEHNPPIERLDECVFDGDEKLASAVVPFSPVPVQTSRNVAENTERRFGTLAATKPMRQQSFGRLHRRHPASRGNKRKAVEYTP